MRRASPCPSPKSRGHIVFLVLRTWSTLLSDFYFIYFCCFVVQTSSVDFRPYIRPIYNAILGRLANQDQDQVWRNSLLSSPTPSLVCLRCTHLLCKFMFSQEVKECAISCMSLVVSTFGDGLQRELPACLPILVDRMGNEITRLTAVKVSFWLLACDANT